MTRLDLHNPEFVTVDMSARERFLSRIVQPDVFFILLIVGVLGLYAEFTHPGMVLPGVVGGIAMILALFAMHILPVNFAGLLLIVAALGLFILEAKYTSHGVLAAGRRGGHAAWSAHADPLAAYWRGRKPGRGVGRYAAVRRADGFSHAPGAAHARLETDHGTRSN